MSEGGEETRAEVGPKESATAAPSSDEVPGRPWEPSPPQIHRYNDPEAVADAAVNRFVHTAKRAVDKFDHFVVVLAGGSTTRLLYRKLAQLPDRQAVPWQKTYFVFSDERCVPPDDEASNYRMVREALFEPLGITPHYVLRMKGEDNPADAARRYETRLGDLFLIRPKPRFDLALLGIGVDGHTASLFPGTQGVEEKQRWVVANHVPQLDAWRLTLTFPALNSARRILFLATGEEKAQAVAEAFGGLEHPEPHPCERVAPIHVRREVLIDRAAAARLPEA